MKRRRCIQSTARPDAGPLTRLAGRKAKSAASLSEDKSPIEGKGASPSEKSHQNTTRIVAVESQRNDGVRRLSPEKSPSTSVNRESSDPEKQQMKINEMFRSICELKDQPPKKMKKRKIDDLPAVPEPQLKSISEYEGTVTKPSFSLPKSAHTVDREVFDVECAAETRIGGRHVNQDAYWIDQEYDAAKARSYFQETKFAVSSSAKGVAIYGVFDGHGGEGHVAAQICEDSCAGLIVEALPATTSNMYSQCDVESALKHTLQVLQSKLIAAAEDCHADSQEFGTTAVIAVLWGGNQLTVANVGDSRAVLYRSLMSSKRKTSRRVVRAVIPLSSDHDLEREDEVVRIKQSPGQIVESRAGIKRLRPTALSPQEMIAKRLGLAMGRSLGHLILRNYGVSAEPEFQTITLAEEDILVLASDGLWDLFSNEEIEAHLQICNTARMACQRLIKQQQSEARERLIRADNTTIVCVRFHSPVPIRIPVSSSNKAESDGRYDSEDTVDLHDGSDTRADSRDNTSLCDFLRRSSGTNDFQRCDSSRTVLNSGEADDDTMKRAGSTMMVSQIAAE